MANKSQALADKSTKLNNRTLCYDGDTIASPSFIYDFLLSGKKFEDHNIFPRKIFKDVKQYNELFEPQLELKEGNKDYDHSWNIPKKYLSMDVNKHIIKLLESELSEQPFNDSQMIERIKRTKLELSLWEEHGMIDLLKTLIYIIDVFREKDIVWGTGRGSSCCCYVLYLIGVHDVDSILYDLDLKEFFR